MFANNGNKTMLIYLRNAINSPFCSIICLDVLHFLAVFERYYSTASFQPKSIATLDFYMVAIERLDVSCVLSIEIQHSYQ